MTNLLGRLGIALVIACHLGPVHAIGVPFSNPLDLTGDAAGNVFAVGIVDDPAAVPLNGFTGADIDVYWDAAMLELYDPTLAVWPFVPTGSAFGDTGYISSVVGLDIGSDGVLDGLRLSIDTGAPRSGPYSSVLFELAFTLIADGGPTQFDVYPTYYGALPPTAPIPEPTTVALTLGGLGLLSVAARRRRG